MPHRSTLLAELPNRRRKVYESRDHALTGQAKSCPLVISSACTALHSANLDLLALKKWQFRLDVLPRLGPVDK